MLYVLTLQAGGLFCFDIWFQYYYFLSYWNNSRRNLILLCFHRPILLVTQKRCFHSCSEKIEFRCIEEQEKLFSCSGQRNVSVNWLSSQLLNMTNVQLYQSKAFVSTYHIIALWQYLYAIWYDYNYVVVPQNIRNQHPMMKSGIGGRYRFLTYWCLVSVNLKFRYKLFLRNQYIFNIFRTFDVDYIRIELYH